MLNIDDLEKMGFEALPTFTVANSRIYKLGRHRHISIGNIGTPNETMWICETNDQNEKEITDAICIHNYDYDGYLNEKKIQTIINAIVGS